MRDIVYTMMRGVDVIKKSGGGWEEREYMYIWGIYGSKWSVVKLIGILIGACSTVIVIDAIGGFPVYILIDIEVTKP